MFTLSTLVLTGLTSLLAGCAIGALLVRTLHPQQQENRGLEQRLQQAEEKLGDYQQEVTQHFAQTSQLVNGLTQSYKEVHEYLANSALKLTTPDVSRQILEAANGKLITEDPSEASEENFEQPRDWAPKSPGEKGALSEDYRLNEDRGEPEATAVNQS